MTRDELPNRFRTRQAINGHCFTPDDAFVGRFVVSDHVQDEFADGRGMLLTGAGGVTLLTVPMNSTAAARNVFRAACGI